MGTFSLWHWIIVILIVAIPIWLAARILGKAGLSRWWAVLNVVPVVNLVMIWAFAFVDWPNIRSVRSDLSGPDASFSGSPPDHST